MEEESALPEDVTAQIDTLINDTYQEHAPFDQIQLAWPVESTLSAQLEQAAENILAVTALHLIEPSALVEQAMKKLALLRTRGKAQLLK